MIKINVYFMPGLAASSLIFERITLPSDLFEIHCLDWVIPNKAETLPEYAERMAQLVTKDNVVLIGVSFGGVLVQEMAAFIKLKKLIIISSVKSNLELPIGLKLATQTKVYKLIPTSLIKSIDFLDIFSFGSAIKKRLKLYNKYLSIREKVYLDWAIEQMLLWNRIEIDKKVIHIHGDKDDVFPLKNIKDAIVVKGGTHIMILSKYKWLNENLPKIILNEDS